jgi:hypothetical protein
MGRIEELCEVYNRSISAPWMRTSSGSERVLMVVYDKDLERSLRNRVSLFIDATLAASHQSKLVDLTTWFSEWMAGQKYAEGYFTSPEDLQTLVEAEFKKYVADRLRKELEAADTETVVSVIGIGSLYGFLKTSELIRAVEPSIKGRMTVFFPGTKDSNNYRMLDAHDGWNYMANGISLNSQL